MAAGSCRLYQQKRAFLRALLVFLGVLSLAGCSGVTVESERVAREELAIVSEAYRPSGETPVRPVLTAESSLETLLTYAILSDPAVEAAYYEWYAAVSRITSARSLPDPRITFESDIAGTVMAVMPGLMFDIPWPGRLAAITKQASAEARRRYSEFREAVLKTAAGVKGAYFNLQALEDSIEVNRRALSLVEDLEEIARAQHATGMVTLQDVLRAEIEGEQLANTLRNLEDSRSAFRRALAGALGLPPDIDAPLPVRFQNTEELPDIEALYRLAFVDNPTLKALEAEITRAAAALRLARLGVVPDLSAGLDIDVKSSPVLLNPQLSLTLPIWRDKIAAEIEAGSAATRSAEARLSRAEIDLAVEFASKAYLYRESERNTVLLRDSLIPRAHRSVEVSRSGYVGGRSSFLDFLDAQRLLLELELAYVEARAARESALASLSLTIAGVVPKGTEFVNVGARNP